MLKLPVEAGAAAKLVRVNFVIQRDGDSIFCYIMCLLQLTLQNEHEKNIKPAAPLCHVMPMDEGIPEMWAAYLGRALLSGMASP